MQANASKHEQTWTNANKLLCSPLLLFVHPPLCNPLFFVVMDHFRLARWGHQTCCRRITTTNKFFVHGRMFVDAFVTLATTSGPKRTRKLFQHKLFGPRPNIPFWAPRKKFMCLISWERTKRRDPHKLCQGDFGGQKGGPKRAIFGHKKFSLISSCP